MGAALPREQLLSQAPLPKAGIIPQTGREPLPRDLFQEETPTVVEQLLSLLSGRSETFTHLVTVTAPCTPGPPPLPDLANASWTSGKSDELPAVYWRPTAQTGPFPAPFPREPLIARAEASQKVQSATSSTGHRDTPPHNQRKLSNSQTAFSLSSAWAQSAD